MVELIVKKYISRKQILTLTSTTFLLLLCTIIWSIVMNPYWLPCVHLCPQSVFSHNINQNLRHKTDPVILCSKPSRGSQFSPLWKPKPLQWLIRLPFLTAHCLLLSSPFSPDTLVSSLFFKPLDTSHPRGLD